jgi:hypothetical protein
MKTNLKITANIQEWWFRPGKKIGIMIIDLIQDIV